MTVWGALAKTLAPSKGAKWIGNELSFNDMNARHALAAAISSMVLGCATNQSFDTTETAQQRAQRERQQRTESVNLGRIGKIDRSPSTIAERWSGN